MAAPLRPQGSHAIDPRWFTIPSPDRLKNLRESHRDEIPRDFIERSQAFESQSVAIDLYTRSPAEESKREYHLALVATNELFRSKPKYHLQPEAIRHLVRIATSLGYQTGQPRLSIYNTFKLIEGIIPGAGDPRAEYIFGVTAPDSANQAEGIRKSLHRYFVASRLLRLRLSSAPIFNFRGAFGAFLANYPLQIQSPIAGEGPIPLILHHPNTSAYIIEEIYPDAITLTEYIGTASFDLFREKFLQLLFALHRVNQEYNFTHYNLTIDNVSLYRPYGDQPIDIQYTYLSSNGEPRTFYVQSTDGRVLVIDGFEYSYLETSDAVETLYSYLSRRNEKETAVYSPEAREGNQPAGSYPLYDVFSFLMSTYDSTEDTNTDYVVGLLELLEPFGIAIDNINRIVTEVKRRRYGLVWHDAAAQATRVPITDYLVAINARTWVKDTANLTVLRCDGVDCITDLDLAATITPRSVFVDNFYDAQDRISSGASLSLDYIAALRQLDSELTKYEQTISRIRTFIYSNASFATLVDFWYAIWDALSAYESFEYTTRSPAIGSLVRDQALVARNKQEVAARKQTTLQAYSLWVGYYERFVIYTESASTREHDKRWDQFREIVRANNI